MGKKKKTTTPKEGKKKETMEEKGEEIEVRKDEGGEEDGREEEEEKGEEEATMKEASQEETSIDEETKERLRTKDEREMKGVKMRIDDEDDDDKVPSAIGDDDGRERTTTAENEEPEESAMRAKFNPKVEREKWIIEELMKPPGWSPYDYPADERDKISFDGWKPEKEEETSAERSTTSKTHSTMAGLES